MEEETISPVTGIPNVSRIKGYSPFAVNIENMDLFTQRKIMQYQAATTGEWFYYKQLLNIQEAIRCHNEVVEKYPYDGKSTFQELLEEEKKNIQE